jgi:type I restriction-modification system DNA methylase subunit
MSKLLTPREKADKLFKKNLTKAARTLISLLDSKDETVRLSATNFIIKKITERPVIIVVDEQKKKST